MKSRSKRWTICPVKMPNLRQQMMRLMSGEIKGDQDMILLLSKKNAEERLAAFIYNLSRRFCPTRLLPS